MVRGKNLTGLARCQPSIASRHASDVVEVGDPIERVDEAHNSFIDAAVRPAQPCLQLGTVDPVVGLAVQLHCASHHVNASDSAIDPHAQGVGVVLQLGTHHPPAHLLLVEVHSGLTLLCVRAALLALHGQLEVFKTDLARGATLAHFLEQLFRVALAQHLRHSGTVQERANVANVEETFARAVGFTKYAPEQLVLCRCSGSNKLAHELLVVQFAVVAQHGLDKSFNLIFGPRLLQLFAHFAGFQDTVVVHIQLHEELVQLLHLRKVLARGEIRQHGFLEFSLLLPPSKGRKHCVIQRGLLFRNLCEEAVL
mmetsp:Transcript_18402/g.43245  ORF Transcript_18402/g.43245 Transcript_18402/m.43245 type:complete len:310 (-) Transcript_18402:1156-2085(-)